MKLIAKVRVVAMVDGVRTEFAPGDELPKLAKHDVEQLLEMGAIEDTDEAERADKSRAREARAANTDFEEAREAVIAANASTKSDPPTEGTSPAAPPAATKPAAKKAAK